MTPKTDDRLSIRLGQDRSSKLEQIRGNLPRGTPTEVVCWAVDQLYDYYYSRNGNALGGEIKFSLDQFSEQLKRSRQRELGIKLKHQEYKAALDRELAKIFPEITVNFGRFETEYLKDYASRLAEDVLISSEGRLYPPESFVRTYLSELYDQWYADGTLDEARATFKKYVDEQDRIRRAEEKAEQERKQKMAMTAAFSRPEHSSDGYENPDVEDVIDT